MSQEIKVRAPGRAIIAVTLIPFTAMIALVAWSAVQSGSLVTALQEQDIGVENVVFLGVHLIGLVTLITGRIPFSRTSY